MELERVKAKGRGLNPFFFSSRAAQKEAGQPGKKGESLEGSRGQGRKGSLCM